MNDIVRLQAEIDDIDDKIIALLTDRFVHSREIGRIKLRNNQLLFDPERVSSQRQTFVDKCEATGIDAGMAERLIRVIVDQVIVERSALKQADGTAAQV